MLKGRGENVSMKRARFAAPTREPSPLQAYNFDPAGSVSIERLCKGLLAATHEDIQMYANFVACEYFAADKAACWS
jgi:hypothetical protein